jgi:hypothetical protein
VTKTQPSGVDLIPLQRRPGARSFLARRKGISLRNE